MDKQTEKNKSVYLTKYALTKGIQKIDGSWKIYGDGYLDLKKKGYYGTINKTEYAFSYEEAKKQVQSIIDKKRKSIEKQLIKLDKIEKSLLNDDFLNDDC